MHVDVTPYFYSRSIDLCYCCCLVAESCPTLCDPINYSLPGSSVHGISQARILEWVVISSFRRSSWPRGWARISCISMWTLYQWAIREDHVNYYFCVNNACIYINILALSWTLFLQLQPCSCIYHVVFYIWMSPLTQELMEVDNLNIISQIDTDHNNLNLRITVRMNKQSWFTVSHRSISVTYLE